MGFEYDYIQIDADIIARIEKFMDANKEAMSYQKDYSVPAVFMAKVRSFEGIVFDIDPLPVKDGALENAQSLYCEWKKAENDYKKSLQIILRLSESGKAKVVTGTKEDPNLQQQPNPDPRYDVELPYVAEARKRWRFCFQRLFLWCLNKEIERLPLVFMGCKQYKAYKEMRASAKL